MTGQTTPTADQFRRTLESEVESEVSNHADEIARDVVTAVWNAVDNQIGAHRDYAHDAGQARNHAQRSAAHIAAKRDLAESMLGEWEDGRLPADRALRMIRAALAVGDVKTVEQLRAETEPPVEDTLPAWLYQRFNEALDAPAWDLLADADRTYWEHHAAAVRRAVARGGSKAAEGAQR